jgi:hypothetical protein
VGEWVGYVARSSERDWPEPKLRLFPIGGSTSRRGFSGRDEFEIHATGHVGSPAAATVCESASWVLSPSDRQLSEKNELVYVGRCCWLHLRGVNDWKHVFLDCPRVCWCVS